MESIKREAQANTKTIEARLSEWGIDLEKFRVRAGKAEGTAKARLENEGAALQTQLNEERKNLEEYRKMGKAATGELKEGIADAAKRLEIAFERARTKFEQ